jgi:hypothetical protein
MPGSEPSQSTSSRYDTSLYGSSVRHASVHFFPSTLTCTVRSVADPRCLSQIPDPNFSIPDPGSKRSRIPVLGSGSRFSYPDPGSRIRTPVLRSGSASKNIPDSGSWSQIQGPKKHQISDLDPQHTAYKTMVKFFGTRKILQKLQTLKLLLDLFSTALNKYLSVH